MIAIGFVASWVLIGAVAGTLWVMWAILNITFDLIERWHDGRRSR